MAQKRSSHPREVELWVIAVVAVVFALLRLGRVIPPPFVGTAEAAACPIVDGGAGDDDASANGVITVSGSKTFTAITGTYDCTARRSSSRAPARSSSQATPRRGKSPR